MKMNKNKWIFLFLVGLLLTAWACGITRMIGTNLGDMQLRDGIYEGSYKAGPNKAEVRVTIKGNRIADITILRNWGLRGKRAEKPTVRRIIENQSTSVDAVSGATNSCRVIMNAVHIAVEKAR